MKPALPLLMALGLLGSISLGEWPSAWAQVPSESVLSESVLSESVLSESVKNDPPEGGSSERLPVETPVETSVESATGLLRQAQTAQREERYEEAAALWLKLVYQWPDSAEMSYNLGVALHRQFKLEDAANAYLTATVLNPNHAEAQINLSLARIQLQQYDEALAALDQVLQLPDRPSDPASLHTMAYYNRAIVLGRQGKTEESLASVNAALEITPDFSEAQALIDLIR